MQEPAISSCRPLGLTASFGFGDRIGLATPGHIAAMREAGQGMAPIFAQQSIREMTRTNRTPDAVMTDAMGAAAALGWTGAAGADADHLKTLEDITRTTAAGFTFFTIDPSNHVDQQADDYDEAALNARFSEVRESAPWFEAYRGKTVRLSTGTEVVFDDVNLKRAGVKYGRAIQVSQERAGQIDVAHGGRRESYEIELSVDETEQPTTLAEHYIIADQCMKNGMALVSLAPRFIGDFEKGVDYKGDLVVLEQSLADHAAIAKTLGPYKLSLHSGSDKLSMYAILARATHGRFHVKTAGTSYLEALRVAAIHDPAFFREIVAFARTRYGVDKATYHVSATLESVPPPEAIPDDTKLEQIYLERWCDVPEGKGFTEPGRQILHCTFGSVLTHEKLGGRLRDLLIRHQDTYTEVLHEHFVRHLKALQAGMVQLATDA